MRRALPALLLLLCLAFPGLAQERHFSTDKTSFLGELRDYLISATSKEDKADAEVLMDGFESVWKGQYGLEESQLAIGLYELMYSKTGPRAYYNIFTFTEILMTAPQSGMTRTDIQHLLSYTQRKFSKRQNTMDKYLKSCRDLFADHILGEKGATQWIAQDGRFSFPTDTAFMLSVSTCDLVLKSSRDQSVIKGTQGLFFMDSHRWIGKGGRVSWNRFGLPEDKVYGVVHDYEVNMTTSNYAIESIDFYHKDYFDHPVHCSFEDAVTNAAPNEKTSYPKAMSLNDNMQSGRLFKNVDFLGGFGMVGKSVNFFGSGQHPAQFAFWYQDHVALRMKAKRFVMSDNSIVSSQAAARIYMYDTLNQVVDSIYHNDLGFRYDHGKHTVLLYRKDNGAGTGPYHDTYHEFDIFLEAIYWDTDSEVMEFRRLDGTSGESDGVISSVNYFRKSDYLKIQAMDKRHPMEDLSQYIKLFGDESNSFNINDYAAFIKYPPSQVVSLMMTLQSEGYLEYDKDTQMVTLLNRFFDVLASNHEEFDYDVIKLQTHVDNHQPNIRFYLTNNDMIVYGIYDYQGGSDVPSITLSDFKHVLILPDDAKIVLKRNRSFAFSGCVMAGMYEFFTKDCRFNYNKFSIQMNVVDSLRFYARFNGKVYPVEGTLEKLAGTLEIDESDNKSSVRETPDYPKFRGRGNAYKFYKKINGSVFDLELPPDSINDENLAGKFYYCLDPISMNSLDNLNSEDIAFQGRLISAGIFPDIVEPLVVMDDHSLGFRHVIGDGKDNGYLMYGGKGGFHQEVHLSNEGFYGKGQLDVETASYLSEHFDFYPDSVVAATESFAMRERLEEISFPKASGGPMDIFWDVTVPQLYAETKEEPVCLYDSTFFRGKTIITDEGLKGDGVLTFGLTRFESDYFDFAARSFVADSSDFVLFDEDGETKAFLADNYRAHVGMGSKKVQFEYLNAQSNLDFPLNQFYCSLNEAEWDMASNNVHLSGEASEFVSLLPEQDSLSFFSTHADYDMNEYVIHAHEVETVKVADVEIKPWDANIHILRNAEIQPLEHATIVADTALRAHVFKDAAVSIYSKNNYMALGTKDYLDSEGVATPLFFEEISPVDGVTKAHAEIPDTLWFMLSPYFGFHGSVTSIASEPFDTYDGYFRLADSCLMDTVWFVSTAIINPDSVSIPINMDKIRKVRQGIFNGLCYEYGSQGGYRVNFLKPMNPETVKVTMQDGNLSYDIDHSRYLIRDTVRAEQTLALDDRCVVTMHGASGMGFDPGLTHFACYGTYTHFPNDSLTMDVTMTFQAPVFDDRVLEEMAEIYAAVEGESIDLTKTDYLGFLRSERGDKAALDLRVDMELMGYPEVKADDFYNQTIVIPSVHLVWNPEYRAFVSEGKIGLGNFGTHRVNRYVDGRVVLDKRLGVITFFFQNDLFMTYMSYNCGDGQLQVHATYGTVNVKLSDMPEKSRSMKADNYWFEYVVTPYDALTAFLSRLKRAGVE